MAFLFPFLILRIPIERDKEKYIKAINEVNSEFLRCKIIDIVA